MDNRTSYEQMLEAQCHNHTRLLSLLQKITEYDNWIFTEAKKAAPDISAVEYCNIQKDRIIKQLDSLSIEISKLQIIISETAESFLDGTTHPLYIRLSKIAELVAQEFDDVLQAENQNNPKIYKNLSALREKLILDAKIKAVPQSRRQIFYVRL